MDIPEAAWTYLSGRHRAFVASHWCSHHYVLVSFVMHKFDEYQWLFEGGSHAVSEDNRLPVVRRVA